MYEDENATQEEIDAAVKMLKDAKEALVEKSSQGISGNNNNTGNSGNGSQNGSVNKKPQTSGNKGAQTGDSQSVAIYLLLIAASVITVSFVKKRKAN